MKTFSKASTNIGMCRADGADRMYRSGKDFETRHRCMVETSEGGQLSVSSTRKRQVIWDEAESNPARHDDQGRRSDLHQ